MKIEIKSNDRVLVVGKTGCGKSVLVKNLLVPQLAAYVMYDYKEEITLPGAVIFDKGIRQFKEQPNEQKVIYRPVEASDDEFNRLCETIFKRGNNCLVTDEEADHSTATKIVKYRDLIMRLGRSKGVGSITCTQRPTGIHNNIVSQCEHFFIFQTLLETDRKKLSAIMGDKVLQNPPKFHFWYFNASVMEEPILCKPVKF